MRVTIRRAMLALLPALWSIGCAAQAPSPAAAPQAPIPLTADDGGGRIVNGEKVNPGDMPWQVQIRYDGKQSCGGALIAPQWVLTAAHCFYYDNDGGRVSYEQIAKHFDVGAGSVFIGDANAPMQIFKIDHVVTNKDWQRGDVYTAGDIALIRLQTAVPLARGSAIDKIALPPPGSGLEFPGPNVHATIAGWGRTSDGGVISTQLLYAQVDTVSDVDCIDAYRKGYATGGAALVARLEPDLKAMSKLVICAWKAADRDPEHKVRTTCQGDSGGPLVLQDRKVVIGIVSRALGCKDFPTKFTRVTAYRQWIIDTMKANAPGTTP